MKFREKAVSENQISITVEPLTGHIDDEIVSELQKLGATDIKVLAKGFISAKLSKNKFGILKRIAYVHIKPLHKLL